jgi:hypothetical protein
VTVFCQVLLRHLNVHLSCVLLEAEIGVFLEPPRLDLAFANAAKNSWRGFHTVEFVVDSKFSKLCQKTRQYLGAGAQ